MNRLLDGIVAREDWHKTALLAAGIGTWTWDLDTDLISGDACWIALTGLSSDGESVEIDEVLSRIHDDDRPTVKAALETTRQSQRPGGCDFRYQPDGGTNIWMRFKWDIYPSTETAPSCITGVCYDITAERRAAEQNAYVAKEMAHRMKNMMALASGLVRMTARSVDTVDEFAQALTARLGALSALNDIILPTGEGRAATLSELTTAALSQSSAQAYIDVDVPDLALNRSAAQTFVLALNELTTNAFKHGALAHDEGKVSMRVDTDLDADSFRLSWTETRPTPISDPTLKRGYGMQVLDGMTQATFRGRPKFTWSETGLDYACEWSLAAMRA